MVITNRHAFIMVGHATYLWIGVIIGSCGLLLVTLVLTLIQLGVCKCLRSCYSRLCSTQKASLHANSSSFRSRSKIVQTRKGEIHNHHGTREGSDVAASTGSSFLRRVRRRQSRPLPSLDMPCKCCHKDEAKRDCQSSMCAHCCRGSRVIAVCQAHEIGYNVVSTKIKSACKHCSHELDISYTQLKTCPTSLSLVGPQLVSLNLSNNRLVALPDNIGELSGVKELFLQYNYIKKIPFSLCHMVKLVELDVKNNHLSFLPEELGQLKNLVILSVTNNHLKCLPHSIGRLTKLEELSLQSNNLKELPNSLCLCTSLKLIYSAENKLSYLPNQIGRLQSLVELDLTSCELAILPESISKCRSLTKLWLAYNRLTVLPFNIGHMSNLKELYLRNNEIRHIPVSMSKLSLSSFTAQNNPVLCQEEADQMTKIPEHSFPPLLELTARAVLRLGIAWQSDTLPSNLKKLLSRPVYCSSCGGPAFMYYSCSVKFEQIGVFYRLPLHELRCSPYINLSKSLATCR